VAEEYRVKRSFAGKTRGQKIELTNADAKHLIDAGYVAEIQAAEPAKKTTAAKK
jgi:hypothetical protein